MPEIKKTYQKLASNILAKCAYKTNIRTLLSHLENTAKFTLETQTEQNSCFPICFNTSSDKKLCHHCASFKKETDIKKPIKNYRLMYWLNVDTKLILKPFFLAYKITVKFSVAVQTEQNTYFPIYVPILLLKILKYIKGHMTNSKNN